MDEITKLLIKFNDFLHVSGPIWHGIRYMTWGFIIALCALVDGLEGVLNAVYDFGGFFNTKAIQEFQRQWSPVFWAIGAVCLAWFFIRYMKNDGASLKKGFDNFLFGLGTIVLLGTLMTTLSDITFDMAKAVKRTDSTAAYSIVRNNVTDIMLFDEDGWKTTELKEPNHFSDKNIRYLDIVETVDPSAKFHDPRSMQLMKNKINMESSGKLSMKALEKGWMTWDEHYYRYIWHPFLIIIELCVMALVLFFTSFKTARLIFELGYNRIIAYFYAFTDIEDGQRIKKIVKNIFNLFITIVLVALIIRCYFFFTEALALADIGPLPRIVLLIAAGWAVMDGPWIIQALTGVDGGLNSVGQNIMGMYAAAKGAKSLGDGVKKAGKKMTESGKEFGRDLGDALMQFGGVTAGAAAGLKGGLSPKGLDAEMDARSEKDGEKSASLEDEMANTPVNVLADPKPIGKQQEDDIHAENPVPAANDGQQPIDQEMNGLTPPPEEPGGWEAMPEPHHQDMGMPPSNDPGLVMDDPGPSTISNQPPMDYDMQGLEPPAPPHEDISMGMPPDGAMSVPMEHHDVHASSGALNGNMPQASSGSVITKQPSLSSEMHQKAQAVMNSQQQPLSQAMRQVNNAKQGIDVQNPGMKLPNHEQLGRMMPGQIQQSPGKIDLMATQQKSALPPRNRHNRSISQNLKAGVDSKIGEVGLKYSEKVNQIQESDAMKRALSKSDATHNTVKRATQKVVNKITKEKE
ncbi:pLS20_p028 family conjugation system transmembrane protein [Listeria booriae]|uniref:pLS20_p028 family conjugation system transmembrane protein n=1 Tax=Listeria booriae TaxID=1552123 RepID=UPI00162767D2|nr:hypothetical protein [Listeria booriae]MBC2164661.1 hypothetical protein [Listeria booriae]